MYNFIKSLRITLLFTFATTTALTSYAQQVDSIKNKANPSIAQHDAITIDGVVTSAASGNPLSGINVTVEGYSSEFTDDNGRFRIELPNSDAVLWMNGDGFQTKRLSIKGKTSIEVALHEEGFISYDRMTTLPYGKAPLVETPWAAEAINMEDKWQSNSESPDSYLQGRISGLNAIRKSGSPGIGANMFLRGFSSLYANNQPLLVVDGMIYDNSSYGASIIDGHVNNPLNLIELKDIDDISIVKDGASYYGTRGANGVIFITTSRAKEEATKIDFAAYGGFNSSVKSLPVMGSADYRTYLSEMLQSRGLTSSQISSLPYMKDASNPDYFRYHNNTDWQKEVTGDGYNQNYFLKVTGGDNIATYGLSVGFSQNEGLISNTNLERYHTRFNGALNMSNSLDVTINLAFTSSEQNIRNQGSNFNTNPLFGAQIKSPFLTTHAISDDGGVSPNLADLDIFGISNPLSIVDNAIGINRNYRFFGSTGFNLKINPNLSAHTLIGVTFDKVRESIFIPEKGVAPDTLSNFIAKNRSGTNLSRYSSLYSDTRLSYQKSFATTSKLAVNLGLRYDHSQSENDFGYGYNSATDNLVTVGHGISELRALGGNLGEWNWMNMYLNADYNYLNRYLLSFNLSTDASSRFGKDAPGGMRVGKTPLAVLPSIAGGWLLSSEEFMANQQTFDLLKLRLSYGLNGNDDIGNYSARQYYVSQNLLGMQGLVRGNIGNPELKWETIEKVNLGIDMSLFNEGLRVSADIYRNNTSDMLIWEEIPTAVGLEQMLTNNGAMKTQGVDLAVYGRLLNRAVKWDLGLHISKYKNTITQVPAGGVITHFGGATLITEEGKPANLFYGHKSNGVFASESEALASHQYNRQEGVLLAAGGGDIHFENVYNSPSDIANGIAVIDENDRQVIGDPNPDFTGMLNNQLKWKRWGLDMHFTFSSGNDIFNATRAALESVSGVENQTLNVNNRWRVDGQQTNVPKATWGDPLGNGRFSDRWIEDGSYIRLRTLSLTYNIPSGIRFINNLSIYLTSNNLLTFTKYKGYDPEMSASGSIFGQGIDLWQVPQFRSTQLGVRIGL